MVDSSYSGGVGASKDSAVRRLIRNVSWVKFSPFYLLDLINFIIENTDKKEKNRMNCKKLFLLKEKTKKKRKDNLQRSLF